MKFQFSNLKLLNSILLASVFFLFLYDSVSARELNVGVYDNSPKVFMNENGEPAGIFIDIINEIAKREGWKLHYHYDTWGNSLDKLVSGELDIMPDVAYTVSRQEIYAYHSEPVLSDWFHVYSKPESEIVSILDLEGKKVIVLERSVQEESFNRLIREFALNIKIIAIPDYSAAFSAVSEKKADAVIVNRFYGVQNYKKYNLRETGIVFNPTRLHFATNNDLDTTVLDAIDEHLKKMKADSNSVYYDSLKKWTSDDTFFRLPVEIRVIIFGLITCVAIFVIFVFILKKQVNRKAGKIVEYSNRLKRLLEEKDVLIQEIHHRVKNNLQLVSSLISLQASNVEGEQCKQLLLDVKNRISAIAFVHEKVYKSRSMKEIFVRDYIISIVTNIRNSLSVSEINVKTVISVDEIYLSVDEAVPCALIINELVTNSYKYAFKNRDRGAIEVRLSKTDDVYTLIVADDGCGFETLPNFDKIETIGLKIVRGLFAQLRADYSVSNENGVKFTISFRRRKGETTLSY